MDEQETIIFENGRDFQRKQDEAYDNHNKFASTETKDMFKDVNEKIDVVGKKMDSIHAAFFGVDDVGGLVKTVEEIKKQTQTTNGRVKKLEMWRFGMEMCGVLISLIIIPLIVFIFFDKINELDNKIQTNVQSSVASTLTDTISGLLDKYNIEIK